MGIGIIVAEFFNNVLIFCSDNKLRYSTHWCTEDPDADDERLFLDWDDFKTSIFELIRFRADYREDRRQNVFIPQRVESDLIAKYEVAKGNPDYAVITELFYDRFFDRYSKTKEEEYESDLLWYVQHYYDTINILDCKNCIEEVSNYFEKINIDSILSSYTIIKSSKMGKEIGRSFQEIGTSYNLESDDSYIKSLITHAPEIYRKYSNFDNKEYEERLFEIEKKNVDEFYKKYNKSEHFKYLLRETINKAIMNKAENLIRLQELHSHFRLNDLIYILTYLRPHMSVSMLCRKFNKEYDGTNMTALFGKEISSRKKRYREYLSRLEKSRRKRRKPRYYNDSSYDPESEIMDALENGDGEIYGF